MRAPGAGASCQKGEEEEEEEEISKSTRFEWLTAEGFTFKLLKICLFPMRVCVCVHVCVCVCPLISNRPCFWLWSISTPPPPQTHTHNPNQISPASSDQQQPSEQAAVRGGGGGGEQLHGSVTHDDCLGSDPFLCKESLAAENAAVSRRFTAQSPPPPRRIPPSEREEDRDVSALSHFAGAYLFHSLMSWP